MDGRGWRGGSRKPEAHHRSPRLDGVVTAVEPQERRGGRRSNVFLDGRYAFSLTTELATSLTVGQPISAARSAELLRHDQRARAFDAGLRFLGPRPRSEREIRDRLARHDFAEPIIDEAIERLRRLKLVDDAAFAEYWVEQRTTHRPRGARLLKQELRLKGVDQDATTAALPDAEDEEESAYRAAQRKAQSLRALDERTFRQRLGGFLQRRGFGYETTSSVVSRLWRETSGQ